MRGEPGQDRPGGAVLSGEPYAEFAHELNNLLMGVIGQAELLLEQPDLDAETRRRIESIASGARCAAELTRRELPPADTARAGGAAGQTGHAGCARPAGAILVIDDEPAVLSVTALALERAGFRVLTAEDGVRAERLFHEGRHDIAAVILDLNLPRVDGEQTLRALRAVCADTPVILTSGREPGGALDRMSALGLAGFVRKPYLPSTLVQELQRILAAR